MRTLLNIGQHQASTLMANAGSGVTGGRRLGDRLAVFDRLAGLDLQRPDHAVDGRYDLLAHAEHVDVADGIATSDLEADHDALARDEIADCRRADQAARRLDALRTAAARRGRAISVLRPRRSA